MKRLLAILSIPLGTAGQWQVLQFKNIPPNKVEFQAPGKMLIKVISSAGPVVHKLEKSSFVKSLSASGSYTPRIVFPKTGKQGEKGSDDFALRIGLVVKGEQRLNWMQKKLAPQWVLKLHDLAPPGVGIERIEFVNLVDEPTLVGKSRKHPKSDLMTESFAALAQAPGKFNLTYEWPKPIEVLAIWISSDGDDTKSSFTIELNDLKLTEPAE